MLQKIIITDKDKCVGCNKCIMVCPIKYANNVEIIDGERKIDVDSNRCIGCGKCLNVCDHNARFYADDTQLFWDDLNNGTKMSVIVAPSFVANRYDRYKNFFGYLKSMGVNVIYDVSFGADIVSWLYVKHIKENNPDLLISQPCPSIVNYIERYTPELIESLAPIHSPMMATAIYLRKYLGITEKIAFISPCISKSTEIHSDKTAGLVDYNIPFEKACQYLIDNDINVRDYPPLDFDNTVVGFGTRYSKPGGLAENLLQHLPDVKIKQIEGPEKVYDYLEYLNQNNTNHDVQVVDILNCEYGCNIGTASCEEECALIQSSYIRNELTSQEREKNQLKRTVDVESYNKLIKLFEETINPEDFFVSYENKSDDIKFANPSDEELEKAYKKLNKNSDESRHINCYSCGYKTCKDMAVAIYNNYNVPDSCYHYNKRELEKKQQNINSKNKKLQQLITEINLNSEKTAESEKYIRTILEHLTESVIVTDENGLIDFANKETEKILGYSHEEYKDAYIQYFIKDLNFKKIHTLNNETYEDEFNIVNIKKETLDLKIECSPLEFKDKKILIFIIQDVTKEKEVENLKNQFISMISHELRTPLTSIRGALGIILSGVLGTIPEKALELLNIANNNCIRLVNLINDILDLEKIKAGKMDFCFSECEAISILKESMSYNEEYAKQYSVSFNLKNEIGSATINVDKDRLIQVITNLLSNAAKFSKKNGVVEVSVKRHQNSILFAVKDNGVGIPKEQYSKIFESFSQVDSSTTRKKGGTGLGLNIAKSIVNKMGGNIWFKSEENIGTTFYFDIPEITQKEFNYDKVLICEDNQVTALCIKNMLKKLGFDSDVAYCAKSTLELLSQKEYKFMTLDIVLPDMSGLDLLKKIRTHQSTKSLPVIVVSASSEKDFEQIDDSNIVTWLEKTFDFNDLEQAIKTILQGKEESKIKILHVEDDNDILAIVQSSLRDVANIDQAKDLNTAISNINKNLYDLIILDYKLPDGDCSEILQNIDNSPNKNAKKIVFSAYEISQSLAERVDKILLKTKVSNQSFVSSIKSFIDIKENV